MTEVVVTAAAIRRIKLQLIVTINKPTPIYLQGWIPFLSPDQSWVIDKINSNRLFVNSNSN